MGRDKQTLPFGRRTIIETVTERVRQTHAWPVIVVAGENWREVKFVLSDIDVELLVNRRPERGMLSSAQLAVAAIPENCDAYMVALGDQPQISLPIILTVMEAAEYTDKGIVVPVCHGKRGHPVLFKARYRKAILDLPEGSSLKAILQTNPQDIEEIAVDQPSILKDIDTPEDYQAAISQID